jgi:hypothetical protein
MGIEPMLAVGHNARNGRFREAVAAFIKDRSWPTSKIRERLLFTELAARTNTFR